MQAKIINNCLKKIAIPVFGSLEFKFQDRKIVDIIKTEKIDKKKLEKEYKIGK